MYFVEPFDELETTGGIFVDVIVDESVDEVEPTDEIGGEVDVDESDDKVETKYYDIGEDENDTSIFEDPTIRIDFEPVVSDNEQTVIRNDYVYESDENATYDPTDETQFVHDPFQNESIDDKEEVNRNVSSNEDSTESQPHIAKYEYPVSSPSLIPNTNYFKVKKPLDKLFKPVNISKPSDTPVEFNFMEVKKQATVNSIISFLQGLSEDKHSEKNREKHGEKSLKIQKPANTKTSKGYSRHDHKKAEGVSVKHKPKSSSPMSDNTNTILFSQIRRMQTRMINNFQKNQKVKSHNK